MVGEFVELNEGGGSVDAESCTEGDEVVGGYAVVDAFVCSFAGDSEDVGDVLVGNSPVRVFAEPLLDVHGFNNNRVSKKVHTKWVITCLYVTLIAPFRASAVVNIYPCG